MKLNYTTLRQNLRRFLPVIAVFALLATTGCGGSGSWTPFADNTPEWKTSHRTLEAKITRMKMQMDGEKTLAERAAFWRTVAALLVVVSCIALVGGAALGSRARRDTRLFCDNDESSTPELAADEVV